MTLPEQLRAIADRIEAATALKRAALDDLAGIAHYAVTVLGATVDSAAVLVAAEDQPGEGHASPPAPSPAHIDARAESGSSARTAPARLPDEATPPAAFICQNCGKQTPTAAGLVTHRSRLHHIRPATRTAEQRLIDRAKAPTNGRGAPPPMHTPERQPVIRKGRETFLCPRCERGFATNEALKGHLQKGHPPVPAPATRPFGELPVVDFPRGGASQSD